MHSLRKLMLVLAKLYLRDPLSAFFTLAFAPVFVALLGVVFGNAPNPMWNGAGYMDANLAGLAAMTAAVAGLLTIPISILTKRESGTLRRFRATPLRPSTYIAADASVHFAMILSGVILAFILGVVVFGARPRGSVLLVLAAACLGALAFLALGYALASLMPTVRTAAVFGNVVVIPMVFFSGATAPIKVMPPAMQHFSRFVPLTHFVDLMRGLWLGDTWAHYLTETIVLLGLFVAGAAIAAWRFRWE